MLSPLIRRPGRNAEPRSRERGVTMALVALSMAIIICMAALSIDIGTLYQAKAEAQRAADAGALTAARFIAISGVTGTTQPSWALICGGAVNPATLAATSMAQQNLIGGVAAGSVNVLYGEGTTAPASTDCSTVTNFDVNPTVTVTVQRANLPVFFARIFSLFGGNYSGSTVSATATAEAYNPSGAIPLAPVNPRCVKPWFVPNQDPGNGANNFVSPTTGSLQHGGIFPAGDIGETFTLIADCGPSGRRRGRCVLQDPSPVANGYGGANSLDYLPGQVLNPAIAIAANSPTISACSDVNNNDFTKAVAGCDQSTVYACGDSLTNAVDLTEDPGPPRHDSVNGAQCLINAGGSGLGNGQDYLATVAGTNPGPQPYTYPFQILAGGNSALVSAGVPGGSQITNSPSIVSLPIYDSNAVSTFAPPTTQVTVIGFLQVFINSAFGNATTGTINVTVMNVAGCGNSYGGSPPPVVFGTSPVPIRLITPP
jgi:Flp pilus assembly protein TadG